MAYETTDKDMMVAIRDKIKLLLESDTVLKTDLKRIYKGTPKSITNYPAVMLDWNDDEAEQVNKGQLKIRERHAMSVIVLHKYTDYDERQDKLLELTGKIKKLIVTNRYLDGLRADDDSWKVQDVVLVGTRYEALVNPKTFVLDSSEIKIEIITEGI